MCLICKPFNGPLSWFCHIGFKTRIALYHFQDCVLSLLCASLQQQWVQKSNKEMRFLTSNIRETAKDNNSQNIAIQSNKSPVFKVQIVKVIYKVNARYIVLPCFPLQLMPASHPHRAESSTVSVTCMVSLKWCKYDICVSQLEHET